MRCESTRLLKWRNNYEKDIFNHISNNILFATILMGLIFSGKIELNENWTFVLSVVQIISWLGYTNLSELEKRYKIVISAFTIVAVCIIGLFYFLK